MGVCTDQAYREILSANIQLNTATWSLAAVCIVLFCMVMSLIYLGLPMRRR